MGQIYKTQIRKKLDNELEILEKELEAKAGPKPQLLTHSFPKDGLSQDFSVIPPMETPKTFDNYSLNSNTLLTKISI